MAATENTKKYITLLVIDLYKQTKPIESLLLLPVDFLIIFLKGLPMKMHDLSNNNECGSTSKT